MPVADRTQMPLVFEAGRLTLGWPSLLDEMPAYAEEGPLCCDDGCAFMPKGRAYGFGRTW